MPHDWILHPLTLCLEAAAGLIACLYLVLVTSNELYSLKRKTRRYQQWTESSMQKLDGRLRKLEASEYSQPVAATSRMPATGPAERQRIIEMAQEGASADAIAAIMRLPRPDVDLVLSCYHSVIQIDTAAAARARRMLPGTNRPDGSEDR